MVTNWSTFTQYKRNPIPCCEPLQDLELVHEVPGVADKVPVPEEAEAGKEFDLVFPGQLLVLRGHQHYPVVLNRCGYICVHEFFARQGL